MRIDVGEMIGGVQRNVSSLVGAARSMPDLIDVLRDTHRILRKLESVVDRLDEPLKKLESALSDIEISPERLARLEQAVFNIERATAGVEATMGALPRVLRSRIERFRPQTAGSDVPYE